MDNATYDGVNLTPINTDETYSRLRVTETKSNSKYESQRREDSNKNITKEANNANDSQNNTKYNMVLIIMVILLLLTLVSITLSVATYRRSSSEQSRIQDQLKKTNNEVTSVLDTILNNMSNNNISDHRNISQILNQLDAKLEHLILLQTQYTSTQTQVHCGPGLWHRLIFLNMSDPTQQCPFAWREYNMNGVRACGRPHNSSGSCPAIRHFTSQQYSKVCGRVIGFQYATPDAFQRHPPYNNRIDLDGINITYGTQNDHIWSYVAGETENPSSQLTTKCPCFTDNGQEMDPPPSLRNYYCESGNPDMNSMRNHLYTDDPLWDGQQCKSEGTCCTGANSPPWFSVQLPAPTTDAIEVSICCDQGTNDEDVPVKLIEIYVQ